jgi:hypothetical protein
MAIPSTACVSIPPSNTVLSEDQTIDLMGHPKKWHRRIVTLRLYPYDTGLGPSNAGWSYAACFEQCDRKYAERMLWMVRTHDDRFKGYAGDRPVTVRVRYDACNVEWRCADLWAGVFVVLG